MNKGFWQAPRETLHSLVKDSYWRDGTAAFKKHVTSTCHREAMCGMISQDYGLDVGELLSTQHKNEKSGEQGQVQKGSTNLRFLAHQGLAFRGQGPVQKVT